MNGSVIKHDVPYYSQWESAALVPEFITGARAASEDPLWQKSGAGTAEEYAYWAPRICGMACLRMALDFFGHPVPPSIPLVEEFLEAGAYVRQGDQVKGLIYAPFAAYVTERWDLLAQSTPELPADQVVSHIQDGHLVILSVYKSIRTLDPAPPSRGGHLVLAVGTSPDHLFIHNPSGLPGQSQRFAAVPWGDLDRFYAGRGIVLGARREGSS
ncbi:C39 family peptidase [Streptomyces cinnamoneus]|uniref:C39 family peptidase n=1 Tax=Streptomyces cinnamoneus TaxID=53446 RepID=UPI0033D38FF3